MSIKVQSSPLWPLRSLGRLSKFPSPSLHFPASIEPQVSSTPFPAVEMQLFNVVVLALAGFAAAAPGAFNPQPELDARVSVSP